MREREGEREWSREKIIKNKLVLKNIIEHEFYPNEIYFYIWKSLIKHRQTLLCNKIIGVSSSR